MRWGGGEAPIRPSDQPPTALMDSPMMSPADQGQVVQIRRATIQPVPDMMALTPGQGAAAAWEDTAAVPHGQGLPLGGSDHSGGPADVQGSAGGAAQDRGELGQHRLQPSLPTRPRGVVGVVAWAVVTGVPGLAADDDPGDDGVTGESPTRLGFQRPGPAGLPTEHARPAMPTVQAVQVDDHAQLRSDPTGDGELAAFKLLAGQLSQGIGGPLPGAAGVVVVSRAASESRAVIRVWPASGCMMPRTATIRSMVTVSHTPRRSYRRCALASAPSGSTVYSKWATVWRSPVGSSRRAAFSRVGSASSIT